MTSLRVVGFSRADEVSATRVEEFRRQEPDVDLRMDEDPLDVDGTLGGILAGDPPDAVYVDRDVIGEFVVRNAILPLGDLMARDGVELRQFRDAALRAVNFRGQVWGVPEFHDIPMLFIHNPALQAAVLFTRDVEFGDWTFLPRQNVDLTIVMPEGLHRIGVDTGLPESLPIWAKANDAELLSRDGRTAQLDDPRLVESLEMAIRLIDAQGGWPRVQAHVDTFDDFGPQNPFAADQTAIMIRDASYLDVLAEYSPYLEFAVKPAIDRHALPITRSWGMAWVIPKGVRDPEAAWRFIRTVTAPDAWVAGARVRLARAKSEGRRFEAIYSGNKVADHAIWMDVYEPSGNPIFDQAAQAIRMVQETGFVVAPNAAPRQVRAAWLAGTRRALKGQAKPAVAMREANRIAQAALDAAG